jgi:hypothetical protein
LFLNSYHVARYETLILRWNFRQAPAYLWHLVKT